MSLFRVMAWHTKEILDFHCYRTKINLVISLTPPKQGNAKYLSCLHRSYISNKNKFLFTFIWKQVLPIELGTEGTDKFFFYGEKENLALSSFKLTSLQI